MTDARKAPGGIHTLRRVIMLLLLGVLVAVAASGVSSLMSLALEAGSVLGDSGFRLAQAIASTVIAVPLGALAYWFTRRALSRLDDRASLLWPVYLTGFGTVALLIAIVNLSAVLSDGIAGDWNPSSLALGVTWGAVWAWHAWMWRARSHRPTRLIDVAPGLGALSGIGVALAGTIGVLSRLFTEALRPAAGDIAEGLPWWIAALRQLAWALLGLLVWWWHERRGGTAPVSGPFARFALVAAAGFIAVATTLAGLSAAVYSLLALALGIGGPEFVVRGSDPLLDRLALGSAAAGAGALLWALLRRRVADATTQVSWAVRLVASGVGLIFAASGLGVVVNALLATLTDPIAGGERSLLFGGLAALAVGGVAWFVLWRPVGGMQEWASFPGRRAYLVVIFGASALTAVVTLLVIAYGVLQSALGVAWEDSVIESIRAPLGLLTATALVAVYHFAVWRASPAPEPTSPGPASPDAASPGPAAPESTRLAHVTLVASEDAETIAEAIHAETGASVSLLRPRTGGPSAGTSEVLAALAQTDATHVLVLAHEGHLEVLALEG